MKSTIIASVLVLALSGCSSTPKPNLQSGALAHLPSWVIAPEIEGGIADTACVDSSGALSIDRSEAIHFASEQLAGQLGRKVAALSKGFKSKTKTTQGINVGSDFNQAGQQLIEQEMVGVKAYKMGIFTINNKNQLCVMVGMPEVNTRNIYQQLKTNSQATINPDDDAVLYQQFKAYQANQSLQQQLGQ